MRGRKVEVDFTVSSPGPAARAPWLIAALARRARPGVPSILSLSMHSVPHAHLALSLSALAPDCRGLTRKGSPGLSLNQVGSRARVGPLANPILGQVGGRISSISLPGSPARQADQAVGPLQAASSRTGPAWGSG